MLMYFSLIIILYLVILFKLKWFS